MNVTDRPARRDLPEFELDCLYDSPHRPREVTVFEPATGTLATSWITADVEVAVPLDQIA